MKDLESQPGSDQRQREEEQIQDLGPMRIKASPHNSGSQLGSKMTSQDDSFEDLKDYEFEGIE